MLLQCHPLYVTMKAHTRDALFSTEQRKTGEEKVKRIILAWILALMLLLPLFVLADGAEWTCPNCGQTGNTGNFCSNCATARPAADWICPNCGQPGNTGNFCSNCATARPDLSADVSSQQTGETVAVNPSLEQIPGETDRVKVIPGFTSASSYIINKQKPNRWIPGNATDGDESTCWQFSAKKGLKGKSWIQISYNTPQTVDEIWFKNGFWAVNDKGGDQYPINARLQDIKVEFCYSGETQFRNAMEFTLRDESRNGWQQFATGHNTDVDQIRISVISSYKGSAFPNDVCLSEVMAVCYAPASGAMPAQEQKAATVYESQPDITGCTLKMKLATRSGPGTQYKDTGTFFQKNWDQQTVLVKKKCWDGSLWWVQVDFQNGSKDRYRVWTGAEKRVNVDLDKVKEEKRICDCDIYPTSDTWLGPGGKYARANVSINRSACGTIWGKENGYVDVEYWFEDDGFDGSHRVWIPENAVYNLYYGDYSGEN